MVEQFLNEKYGNYITSQLMTNNKEVVIDNVDKFDDQEKVIELLKTLKDIDGNNLVPKSFLSNDLEWGVDFSSWIGSINKSKKYFFIGAEPHLNSNYQLVYDFGNFKNKNLNETAQIHYERETDIWHYLTKIFVQDLTNENITGFLEQCYITDLCHIVPKGCGQVDDICNKVGIKKSEWKGFRTAVAKRFLINEIKTVNPEYIILHGNSSRDFFKNELNVNFNESYKISNSIYTILEGTLSGYKIISIPHLKGDVRNKLWKCKKYPERPESARNIIRTLLNLE